MAELNVRFNLSFGKRSLRCIMASCMIFSIATEVASESVTLTTYYPAPSGVYTQMITTGNTYLDRDSLGKVGIQTAAPLSVLSVSGNMAVGGYATTNAAPANGMIVQGSVGIGTPAPAYTLDVNGDIRSSANIRIFGAGLYNSSGSQMLQGNANDWLRINQGNSFTNGTAAYGNWSFGTGGVSVGAWQAVPGGSVEAQGAYTSHDASCGEAWYQIDGNTTCAAAGYPGNTYATMQSGVISQRIMVPLYTNGAGATQAGLAPFLCCSCPAGVCPNLP